MAAPRSAILAAREKSRENFEAGKRAWNESVALYPCFAPKLSGKRYTGMLDASHDKQVHAVGRKMFAGAKAQRNSIVLMGIVVPLMDPQNLPKTIDKLEEDATK